MFADQHRCRIACRCNRRFRRGAVATCLAGRDGRGFASHRSSHSALWADGSDPEESPSRFLGTSGCGPRGAAPLVLLRTPVGDPSSDRPGGTGPVSGQPDIRHTLGGGRAGCSNAFRQRGGPIGIPSAREARRAVASVASHAFVIAAFKRNDRRRRTAPPVRPLPGNPPHLRTTPTESPVPTGWPRDVTRNGSCRASMLK